MSCSHLPVIAVAEVDYTIEKMPAIIKKLRQLSPFVSK